jgi:hypothetical protein
VFKQNNTPTTNQGEGKCKFVPALNEAPHHEDIFYA